MSEKPRTGLLMLLCAPRRKPVPSGVHFTRDVLTDLELEEIPLHCPLCHRTHAFKFADAWIEQLH
jgi:hypothetical protein